LSGALVNILTRGTITNPASIARAPALMGDCRMVGNELLKQILRIINPVLNPKQLHTAARLTLFQYNPYKNGARNDPAKAPHEIPISWAIKVIPPLYWAMAITDEIITNTTISIRINKSCFLSVMFLMTWPFRKSKVKVEAEDITKDERVDIEAANTIRITTPIMTSENCESIVGIIESYTTPFGPTSTTSAYNRPKLPKK